MFHGGTSFGWMNGANSTARIITFNSYDYDSPLDEVDADAEYFFRDTI